MKFIFYKRKEYVDYLRLPSEEEIREELTILYNNNLFKEKYVNIEINPLDYFFYNKIDDCLINFSSEIIIESENDKIIYLSTILFPTNNVVGMNTDDINDESVFVLDESYLKYLDKAIRYIKIQDDSVYYYFNTDNEIIKFCKKINMKTQEFYKFFKENLESEYKLLSKYYDYFRYAEVAVKQAKL